MAEQEYDLVLEEDDPPDLEPELRAVDAIHGATGAPDLAERIVHAVADLIPCDAVALVTLSLGSADVAWWPPAGAQGHALIRQCLDTPGLLTMDGARMHDGVLTVPLRASETPRGWLGFARPVSTFTRLELERIALLSLVAALALDRADGDRLAANGLLLLAIAPRLHNAVARLHAHLRLAREAHPASPEIMALEDVGNALGSILSEVGSVLRRRGEVQ